MELVAKSVLVVAVVFLSCGSPFVSVQCQEQYLELYTNTSFNNSGCGMIFREDQPDMELYRPCLYRHHRGGLRGRVLVYNKPDYTMYEGSRFYDTHTYFAPLNQPWWPTIRFVGLVEDMSAHTLNLYSGLNWTAQHTLITADTPNFTGSFSSALVTGPRGNEDWTLYTLPNYAGFSVCVKYPDGIASLANDVGVPPGSIKSFRPGCLSKNIARTAETAMLI